MFTDRNDLIYRPKAVMLHLTVLLKLPNTFLGRKFNATYYSFLMSFCALDGLTIGTDYSVKLVENYSMPATHRIVFPWLKHLNGIKQKYQ